MLPKPLLTILVPVFNEEKVVPLFFERMAPVLSKLSAEYRVNLVFIDNCSTDGTRESILRVRERFPETYLVALSRNVGYQRGLEAGLRHSDGDLFVFIDVDCEDPPEMIPDFVSIHGEGADIVYGERVDREEASWIKLLRKLFYRVLRAVADDEVILDMAEFSLLTREVRDTIVQDLSSYPFIRASIGRVGFRRRGIPYRRGRRIAGQTHYNFWEMTEFAVAGILSSSTLFLRLPIYLLGPWLVGMTILASLMVLRPSPWVAPVTIALGFGFCGASLSFLCMYMARTYKNTLGRPNAFVLERFSLLQPPREATTAATSTPVSARP